MPPLATATDAFSAIADPQRRALLGLLASREWCVNDLADELDVAQPRISKHLKVLRQVNLVTVRGDGAHRMYRASASALKPVHDWVKTFEQHWNERFDRLDEHLRAAQRDRTTKKGTPHGRRPD